MTMNVNLPVTHIPDAPDAAADGIKGTQEIADSAADSVAALMAEALGGHSWGRHSGRAGAGTTADLHEAAGSLADVYNAGKSIYENSAAIMATPSQPHTAERLAMAAGIVTLAGSAAGAGLVGLGQAIGAGISSGQGDFVRNAGHISDALRGNADAQEFRQVLGVFASEGEKSVQSSGILDLTGLGSSSSSSSSSGKKGSFFDMIIAELIKAFTGTQDGNSTSSTFSASSASSSGTSSSLSGTSPIMEFLGNFVMDQAV